jgi:hypothetical protein
MNRLKKFLALPAIGAAILGGGAIAGYTGLASAQTSATSTQTPSTQAHRGPGVHGTVTAVNGSTITITQKMGPNDATGTTYTIDASSATVKKFTQGSAPATIAVSDIAVGDEIGAMGTVSGTSVAATEIMDGKMGMGFGGRGMGGPGRGHGAIGTVSAINGSTITLTGKDGKTYTIDAGSATVEKTITTSLSDVTVGDTIGVEGSVSGTSVTATKIMDDLPAAPTQAQAQ